MYIFNFNFYDYIRILYSDEKKIHNKKFSFVYFFMLLRKGFYMSICINV